MIDLLLFIGLLLVVFTASPIVLAILFPILAIGLIVHGSIELINWAKKYD